MMMMMIFLMISAVIGPPVLSMGRCTGHYYKLFKFMLNLYCICSLSNNHAKLQINVLNFLYCMVNFSYHMVNISYRMVNFPSYGKLFIPW